MGEAKPTGGYGWLQEARIPQFAGVARKANRLDGGGAVRSSAGGGRPPRVEQGLGEFAADEGAAAASGFEVAFGGELVIGGGHGAAGDAEGGGEIAGGRHALAAAEAASEDAFAPFLVNPAVEGGARVGFKG